MRTHARTHARAHAHVAVLMLERFYLLAMLFINFVRCPPPPPFPLSPTVRASEMSKRNVDRTYTKCLSVCYLSLFLSVWCIYLLYAVYVFPFCRPIFVCLSVCLYVTVQLSSVCLICLISPCRYFARSFIYSNRYFNILFDSFIFVFIYAFAFHFSANLFQNLG